MIQENEELGKIQRELDELRRKREELSANAHEKEESINSLKEKSKQIEEEFDNSELKNVIEEDLNKLKEEIKSLEEGMKQTAKELEDSSQRLKTIIDVFNDKIENSRLLSEEGIKVLIEENEKIKLEENKRSEEIKAKFDVQKKVLSQLKGRKTRLENNIAKVEALGLSPKEYKEITSTIRKTTIMNAILEKKGLGSIISKKASERTKEEKELLKQTKEEILYEISQLKKSKDSSYSVLDAIEALYSLDVKYELKGKPRVLTLNKNELIQIQEKAMSLPYKVIDSNTKQKEYIPEKAPEDMKEAMPNNETKMVYEPRPAQERITIFKDKDNYYVRKYAAERLLDIKEIDTENAVRINGSLCYKIKESDVEIIKANANKDFSQYITTIKEVSLNNEKTPKEEKPLGTDDIESILLDGLNKVEPKEEDKKEEKPLETSDIESILDEGLNKIKEDNEEVEEIPYDETIKKVEEEKESNKVLSVEEILDKLTKDLDIKKHDAKRYTRSKISCTQNFKNELSSGNYAYNIVHTVPSIIGLGASLLSKLSASLFLTSRGKKAMNEVSKRLDSLSKEELELLFREYKGSRLKTDMNNQINALIIDKLRRYTLEKVEKINNEIKENYTQLFATFDEIEAIEANYQKRKNSKDINKAYEENHKKAMRKAASLIRNIESKRTEADNLLSGGLHGLEEDYKAVASKLSYVGLRFTKEHDFNNRLQAKLAKADRMLQEGLAEDNEEKIINGYMEKERLYYENTKVSNSIFGKRSTGEKYYTPYAERLDYRPDPFIRDLITTVATTTAVVSAVNAVRVHQIEAQQVLAEQQRQVNSVNKANEQILDHVGSEASKIVDGRATIQKGLEAQMHQDILATSDSLERYTLDHLNWTTGTAQYRALDDANHAFYNSFYDNVTLQLNTITNNCRTGAISHAEALQQMEALAQTSQSTLVDVAGLCLNELKVYAPAHSQFDLHGPMEALQYIIDNPNAIIDMNETAINATNIAEGLMGLSPEYATALSVLPSDWLTTMVNVAGSAALVTNVVKGMATKGKGNSKAKWKESEDIRKMMDEFIESQKGKEQEEEKARQR